MIKTIRAPKQLRGVLRIPGDRSITVRAVLLGSIANGVSVVRDYLESDDTTAAINIMRALGVEIEESRTTTPALRIQGVGLHGLRAAEQALYCDSSGTTMRLMSGLLAGQQFSSTLDGSEQLRKRPMRRITDPLMAMGARINSTDGHAPLYIEPAALHGIEYTMPVASAQVKSALLLAALYADGDVVINEIGSTRDHTERMLRAMSVEINYVKAMELPRDGMVKRFPTDWLLPLEMRVPADFSSAAFFITAGVLHPRSRLELPRVGTNPTRTGLLEALRVMGADIHVHNSSLQGGEPVGDVLPVHSSLRAVEISGDLSALMMDEFPIFAVAATQAQGTTVVRDAQELRVKESNRIDGLVAELRKMGAQIEATPDGFEVHGPTPLRGAVVESYDDHRMAMALSIAALLADGVTTIVGAECVSKTYPRFFEHLAAVSSALE
jgi:3-phosphoshikimate 1-carboxyvinyltransferase